MAKVGKLAEKSPWDGRKIEFYTFPKIIPKFLSKNAIKSQFFNWGGGNKFQMFRILLSESNGRKITKFKDLQLRARVRATSYEIQSR